MDTSLRLCSTLKLRPRRKLPKKDLISRLPDDILVCILSFLTVKEAGRISLLSKRWRYIWAYVPLLIFDASRISEVLVNRCLSMVVETKKFVHWVDQVVSSYKASTVDEFRLRFLLGGDCSDNINNWVRFAMEKRVKKLELNFGSAERGSSFLYTLPSLSSCNSLTSLQLDFVDVIGEVLERLIYNCKALEFLSVQESRVLVALNVFSPSLKSLRVLFCHVLKNLEIVAPNLVSMDYYGKDICISFKSTPKLTELYVGGISKPNLVMSPIIHQIEVLKLEIYGIEPFSRVFPNCKKVKTLDVSYDPECDNDLFCVSSVIKACPLLQKLVIQIDKSGGFEMDGEKWDMSREEPWCLPT